MGKDITDPFEFLSLLFELGGFTGSLVGVVIHDGLEFLSGGNLGDVLSVLLVADWGQGVDDVLEIGGSLGGGGDVLVEGGDVLVATSLELSVDGIVFLLVSGVAVFDVVEQVEQVFDGFTGVVLKLNGNGVDHGLSELGGINLLELRVLSCEGGSGKHNDQKEGSHV